MVDDAGLLPWLERILEDVPGARLLDAHTHIGSNDPDEYRCSRQELVERLDLIDAHAIVFPMHEPDGYPPANDMIIAESEASGGRLFPFCRLDPAEQPLEEARRALDAGARGIKLHPRAEGFTLHHPELPPVFELAHERRLPILCHAGRGIPALGRHSIEVCSRYPGLRLILAHAGISDLSWIWREAADHPNLFFDTAWWSPSDVQALFALVPPGQILMASDAPYATPAWGATMALRHGLQVGFSPEVLRELAGGQALRLLEGEDPLDLGPPAGIESLSRDPLLERVYSFLIAAIGQMFNGVDPHESLALARLACDVGPGVPHAPVYESIISLLDARAAYDGEGDGRPRRLAPGVHLIVVAAAMARTPDVALPDNPRVAAPAPGSAVK
ncbi:MAG TPA: amidohydrolase family protein [Thermoleophilaceae bacterium]|nr:amidohydrolase family protein [Thermoleophilaceae bacterium]